MKADHILTYDEALDWLHSLLRFGLKPGLERMNWMLEELGHPERNLLFVHVAGTNGKGSTCTFLTHVMLEAGISVGTFTSPYITDFRERIRFNNQLIPQDDLVRLVDEIKPLVGRCEQETEYGCPTEFEVITLLAICYFGRVVRPAIVIWETGLGGRLDSTNVVHPIISVITNVGLDHTNVLGSTIGEIALEKAGIIKSGVPVVVGQLQEEALDVISRIAKQKNSRLYRLGNEFYSKPLFTEASRGAQHIEYGSLFRPNSSTYQLGLLGKHQVQNAGVALMVLDLMREFYAFFVEEEDRKKGLAQATWPGRLEIVSRKPLCMIDGAHNTEGITMLVDSLAELANDTKRIHLMFSALEDKPLPQMARVLKEAPLEFANVYLTSFDFPRAASVDTLEDAFLMGGFNQEQLERVDDWEITLREWLSDETKSDETLLICGSLYFISLVRSIFLIPVEQVGE
ncbi:bifunctional folylpolyglutamate synthase/dihydrofolate synthase [Brevibacillus laterosporus]|uniref:bifunctional folylpolyglutamate synthase/dihydrofolate synthase n=1 Tax=Brevibacillus laterosporus TaxID=1465 RepID=UPI0026571BE1|nr:folylpolyglutamate synthase/dihydrofolate synthase family protein [Brevibacillus laterosporus]MDN9012551.1 folylpolyglutamate synthase/dihydrofolate synthase family protein [Brevibacillus laterosporus]MDO0939836.1 folylpolyglutamate synthase/dihydrofolate synthase family protein [Brevibacillus laterosporus]